MPLANLAIIGESINDSVPSTKKLFDSGDLAGIIGASLAPYIATWLATHYGLASVGYYLSGAGLLTLIALLLLDLS